MLSLVSKGLAGKTGERECNVLKKMCSSVIFSNASSRDQFLRCVSCILANSFESLERYEGNLKVTDNLKSGGGSCLTLRKPVIKLAVRPISFV